MLISVPVVAKVSVLSYLIRTTMKNMVMNIGNILFIRLNKMTNKAKQHKQKAKEFSKSLTL